MTDLAKADISAGDTIYVAAVYSAHWDNGNAAADVVPDSCATLTANHDSVIFNMKKALSYTVQ